MIVRFLVCVCLALGLQPLLAFALPISSAAFSTSALWASNQAHLL